MGERTRGLDDVPAPREAARQLGGEIAALRGELDVLVRELDRRRHEALDVKLQLRRHAVGATVTGAAFVAAAAGFVWLGAWRDRRRQRLMSRAGHLRRALSRMIEQPERVAAEPTVPVKILTAAANAAVAAVIKNVLERVVMRALEAGPRAHEGLAQRSGQRRHDLQTAA
jgi:hypothetical protein